MDSYQFSFFSIGWLTEQPSVSLLFLGKEGIDKSFSLTYFHTNKNE